MPDEQMALVLRAARILQAVFLLGLVVCLVILIALPFTDYQTVDLGEVITLTVVLFGFTSVIQLIAAHFLPRLMIRYYRHVGELGPQSLLPIQIFRVALFEAIGIYGLLLGFFGVGFGVSLVFLIVSASALILTFPTEERWTKLLE